VTAHLVTAHIAGAPVEEILPPLVTITGVGFMLARAWPCRTCDAHASDVTDHRTQTARMQGALDENRCHEHSFSASTVARDVVAICTNKKEKRSGKDRDERERLARRRGPGPGR
jgi:hypothetical protein